MKKLVFFMGFMSMIIYSYGQYNIGIYDKINCDIFKKYKTNVIQFDDSVTIKNNLSVTGTSVFTKQISVTMYIQSYATPAMTIDFNNSNNQKVILTGATTDITFSNGSSGAIYRLLIYQDGTGGRLLTYANAKFPGGVAPVLTSTLNALDILTFVFDGTNYNCIGFATDLK